MRRRDVHVQIEYVIGRVESLLAARPDRSLDDRAILNAFPNESLRTIETSLERLAERGRIERVPGGGWRIVQTQKAGA